MKKITAIVDQNGRPDMNYSLGRVFDWCSDNVIGDFTVDFVRITGYTTYNGSPRVKMVFTVAAERYADGVEPIIEF